MRKKKILPFVTSWIGLKGIMLREISQTEKGNYNTTYTWSDKAHRNRERSPGAGRWGKWDVGHRAQTSSCTISSGDPTCSVVTIINNTVCCT